MKSEKAQFKLALPKDVKAWLEMEAARNVRSQSAEIIHALREKMADRGKADASA